MCVAVCGGSRTGKQGSRDWTGKGLGTLRNELGRNGTGKDRKGIGRWGMEIGRNWGVVEMAQGGNGDGMETEWGRDGT